MRRRNNQSKNTIFLLILLVLVGIGIAYAVLTEQLTINNTVSYDAMKWDVGFTAAEDGFDFYANDVLEYLEKANGTTLEEEGMTRDEFIEGYFGEYVPFPSAIPSISVDKKTLNVNCELNMTSNGQVCLVRATITNDGTFNVALSEYPIITYDDTYVEWIDVVWSDDYFYEFDSMVTVGQTIDSGESASLYFIIATKELTEDMLPSTLVSIPVTIQVNFEEVDYSISDMAMLPSRRYGRMFWSDTYISKIKNITFENEISIPSGAIESWNLSAAQDGRVMSYIVPNEADSTYYDLYIQSDEQLYASFDMSNWFADFENVDSISGLELLDTSYTTDMSYMFWNTGYNSEIFTMNVSGFNTSNVTNMHEMFWNTGRNNPTFTLDVSGFDTSSVTDIAYIFDYTGYNSTNFVTEITIRNSNIESYYGMFTGVATQPGSQITVNYTRETSDLVDQMIATKSTNSNVVKGVQVD